MSGSHTTSPYSCHRCLSLLTVHGPGLPTNLDILFPSSPMRSSDVGLFVAESVVASMDFVVPSLGAGAEGQDFVCLPWVPTCCAFLGVVGALWETLGFVAPWTSGVQSLGAVVVLAPSRNQGSNQSNLKSPLLPCFFSLA